MENGNYYFEYNPLLFLDINKFHTHFSQSIQIHFGFTYPKCKLFTFLKRDFTSTSHKISLYYRMLLLVWLEISEFQSLL